MMLPTRSARFPSFTHGKETYPPVLQLSERPSRQSFLPLLGLRLRFLSAGDLELVGLELESNGSPEIIDAIVTAIFEEGATVWRSRVIRKGERLKAHLSLASADNKRIDGALRARIQFATLCALDFLGGTPA